MKAFQKRLRRIRLITDIAVGEICESVGITRQTLRNVEELKYNASEDLLQKLMNYFILRCRSDIKARYWFNEIIKGINVEEEMAMRLKDLKKRLEKIDDSHLWNDIRIRLRSEKKVRLKYARLLFNSILEGTQHIIYSLMNEDAHNIKRYYLKPLIEDYINLKNIRYYGKDYVNAMNINNEREVLQAKENSSFREVYEMLGESVHSFNAENIKEKQKERHFKIKDKEVKSKMEYENGEIKYYLFFNDRLDLYKEYEEDAEVLTKKFIAGLYDYVNNYSHLNLYYIRKVESDDDKFTKMVMDFINNVTIEAIKDIGKIFDIKDRYLKELYTVDDYDEYTYDEIDSDDISMYDDDELQSGDTEG